MNEANSSRSQPNGYSKIKCLTYRCKRFKPLDEFYKFERGAFGVMSICKECIKQYELGRREIRQKRCNDRYKNDPEYRELKKQKSREWNKAHSEQSKEWRKNHLERFRAYQREYKREHPGKNQREYQKEWRRVHPEHLNKYRKKSIKQDS